MAEDCIKASNRKRMANEPDMHEPFTFTIVDSRDSDLSEYDGTIGCRTTPNFDQIGLDGKLHEVCIGYSRSSRPHLWLVHVPMMTGFDDGGLDIM